MKYKSIKLNKQLDSFLLIIKESRRIVFLLCLFICGLIIGSFAVKNNDSLLSGQLEEIIKSAILKKEGMSFINAFCDSLITDFVFLLLAFSLGLCAIGIPVISVLPLIKGFSVGITGSFIYSEYSVKGVCYCLLVFFPAQILMSAILIIACNEGFYMSADLFSTLNNSASNEKNLIRMYLTRFGVLLLFTIAVSLLDGALTRLFSSFFAFG